MDLGFNIFKKIRVRLLDFDAIETRHTHKFYEQEIKDKLSKQDLDYIAHEIRLTLEELLETKDNEYLILESKKLDSFGRSLAHIYKIEIQEHAIVTNNISEILSKKQNQLLKEKRDEKET